MGLLEGKVAFITGGAQGQGRSHAVTLAKEGADIVVTDILEPIPETLPYETSKPEHLAETVRLVEELDRRCLSIKADARSSSEMKGAVDQAIGEFGKIDILSVNHGLTINVGWDVQTDEIWDTTVDNNLNACWRTARAVIPHMIENGGGAIVFTSSAAAQTAYASLSAYTAAKTGVIGLMRSLATELAPHWIRVNAILPGAVATQMLHSQSVIDMFTGKPGATIEEMAPPAQAMSLLPLPWIEPVDISNGLLYLVSDMGRYVTGIELPIDAGTVHQPAGVPPATAARLGELEAWYAQAQAEGKA